MTSITADSARTILTAAIAASEQTVPTSIAVVDAGGHLVAFHRVDGATLGSIDIAIKKARTAVLFGMPTGTLGDYTQPGGPLFNIELTNGGLVSFPGGMPVTLEGTLVGAVGASGGLPEQDELIATTGAGKL